MGAATWSPGLWNLLKLQGVYFIAPLSNLPNYRGVGLRSKLPSATIFVKVDRTTDWFSPDALQNNNSVLTKAIRAVRAALKTFYVQ